MQKWFLILASLLTHQTLAAEWETQIFSSQVGSCATGDLNFTALRFTKIPLKSDAGNLFLRVIIFMRANNTQAVRLTTQELLGCQSSTSGGEICSYRPIANQWIESRWSKGPGSETLDIGSAGLLNYDQYTSKISISFKEDFAFPELAGLQFKGQMILVNFNDQGVNTQKLCQPN